MRIWTPQGVLEAIQARHQQGLPLFGLQKIDRGIGYAARKYWGSWEKAVAAAGIAVVAEPPEHWGRKRVLDELRAWDRRGRPGRKIRGDQRLSNAAIRYFGGWCKALAAARLRKGEA
jgi:hypothetical protein